MASSLEHFVNNVRTMSSSGSYRELCVCLSKFTEILLRNGQLLDNVLETLDIQQHSLGVLALLNAKYKLAQAGDTRAVFNQAAEFISCCNGEQVRFSPETFAELCHSLTVGLVEAKLPIKGIDILVKGIQKIQLFDSQLTAIHADLCQLCLLAKCPKPALQFLDVDITAISPETNFDSRPFMLYYYYGGMIYLTMKNYERALYFLEAVICTPALAVSHIMLEAYKKYILVGLILNGKVPPIPKYSSQVVTRFIKPLSQAYHDLAATLTTYNCAEARQVITKYEEIFARDKNLGLAKQVVTFLNKKNIQRLTKTFLTLSLTDVASRVNLGSPAEAEKYILNMIEDGEIFATINQRDGMVLFLDPPENYDSPAMLNALSQKMAICMELDRQVLTMDEQISVSPQFIKKSTGNQEDDMPPATQASKTTYTM